MCSNQFHRDRYLFVLNLLVGQPVDVAFLDGHLMHGVLHTATPFGSISHRIVIKASGGESRQGAKEKSFGSTVVLDAKKVAHACVTSKALRENCISFSLRIDGDTNVVHGNHKQSCAMLCNKR
mmetsp:Transcript_22263/g.88369  ORF Transcript_22263/g.88369 Transcript_22263/m.88369 type:complete len:123 (-) Transcript_22263:3064-3432(-)